MKFGILVVGGHLEGTVSPIFYLGLSFYFMESRKFWCKKWQKVSVMYHPIKCPPSLPPSTTRRRACRAGGWSPTCAPCVGTVFSSTTTRTPSSRRLTNSLVIICILSLEQSYKLFAKNLPQVCMVWILGYIRQCQDRKGILLVSL